MTDGFVQIRPDDTGKRIDNAVLIRNDVILVAD